MKNYLSLCLMALLISASVGFAQKRETKNVAPFSKISFGVPGKAYIKQGSPQKVELEGSADALSRVDVEVEGSKLTITPTSKWNNWSDNEKINVYITVENIESLSVSGSGELIAETKIKSSELDLKVSGSGALQAEVAVSGELEVHVSGSGKIDVKGSTKNFDGHLSGSGKIDFQATVSDKAEFNISGSGKIEGSGKANTVKTSISGSGRLMAANLETKKCDVKISGSGDVEINVSDDLDAQISGSGTVSYKGNPDHINSNATGSGKLRKL